MTHRLEAALAVLLAAAAMAAGQPSPPSAPPAAPPAPAAPAVAAPAPAPALPAPASRPKAPRPTTEIPPGGCVTADCHANVKGYRVVHGPVNVGACDACHTLTDASKHAYKLARPKTEICAFCHKLNLGNNPVVHKPVTTGDCLQCHNPHGGSDKRFIRGANMREFCNSCHKDVVAGKKRAHGPAVSGACGACHQAHAGKYPKLLVAQGRDLCLLCHKQMGEQMKTVRFPHKAVETDCLACHDAHASNFPMFTRQAPVQLCTSACHEKVRKEVNEAKFKHGVVTADQGCLNCHTAHGGNLAKLMKTAPLKVCMTCHDKKIDRPGASPVHGVPEVLDPKLYKHGPIAQGNCSGCHQLHGSNIAKLLVKPYPEDFYAPFTVERYELCFTCHDAKLALLQRTAGLTRFRNGDLNLHYVHVNKTEKGRSCRACHSTHASKNPMHVTESVPYGQWKMPVNFTPSATGGRCAVGCHQELTYDRNNPVPYKRPEPLPAPMGVPDRKETPK